MKIRSTNEIKTLDDELNLFEETDWDFLSVVDRHDTNFEYFNDIRDTDFDKRHKFDLKGTIIPVFSLIVLLGTCIFMVISTGVFDKTDYNSVLNIQSINQSSDTSYVNGADVDSENFLAITGVLSRYFRCLQDKNDYNELYEVCSATSTFADTYYNSINKVEVLFDKNDCYARALREFGGFCRLSKVNRIIYKDDIYYCYANLTMPTSNDIYEYVYLYSYNFTKEFNTYLPTEAGIVKYLLELIRDNQLPCSSMEVCIKFVEKDGKFKITDDSFITSTCVDAYTSAVSQISTILGSNLTND